MPTSESQTTGVLTISVSTMSAISIDLGPGAVALPRQARSGRTSRTGSAQAGEARR